MTPNYDLGKSRLAAIIRLLRDEDIQSNSLSLNCGLTKLKSDSKAINSLNNNIHVKAGEGSERVSRV